MQLVAERLFRSAQLRVATAACVRGEDRRPSEPEQVVPLERACDVGVHVAELRAVALIKDDHRVAREHLVALVRLDERRQLLDRRDDDPRTTVLKLLLQYRRGCVRVCRALLEPVILTHRLVVEVLAIHDEQHLVHTRHLRGELRCLERSERLARTGRVPDVSSGIECAERLVVRRDLDLLQDPLGRDDLVRTHHQQVAIRGEHAVLRQDVQQRMLREERFHERGQLRDRLVVRVGPPTGELERVARLPALASTARLLLLGQVPVASAVGVVLRQRAIADHKQLHILEQARARPEAVTLVTIDLVERLADVHATPLQLDVHHRQPVDEHGHVVPVGVLRTTIGSGTFAAPDLVLVNDLQLIIVDVRLVNQRNVLRRPIIAPEDLDVVLLDTRRLLDDAIVGTCDLRREELLPLGIREGHPVDLLELHAEVRDQLCLRCDRQVLVGLPLEESDHLLLECGLRLIRISLRRIVNILSDDRALRRDRDRIVRARR